MISEVSEACINCAYMAKYWDPATFLSQVLVHRNLKLQKFRRKIVILDPNNCGSGLMCIHAPCLKVLGIYVCVSTRRRSVFVGLLKQCQCCSFVTVRTALEIASYGVSSNFEAPLMCNLTTVDGRPSDLHLWQRGSTVHDNYGNSRTF